MQINLTSEVTTENLNKLYAQYGRTKSKMRFGQMFINLTDFPKGELNTKIFYEKDTDTAYGLIFDFIENSCRDKQPKASKGWDKSVVETL